MEIDVVPLVKNFLSKNEITISDTVKLDELVEYMAKHFEALIFNITSLAALVAIIQDKKKIIPRHLVSAQAYIAQQCVGDHAIKKIKGGMGKKIKMKDLDSLPIPEVEGFEMDATAYSCTDIDMRSMIHNVLDFHELTIGKSAMKGIKDILQAHLGCLLKDIKASEPLTMGKLNQIMSLRRHAVFQ